MLDINDLTAVQYDLRSIYAGRPLLLLAVKIKAVFSWVKFDNLATVALLFLFDN